MISNLKIKTSIIKFKIFTEDMLVNIFKLIDSLRNEMESDFSGHNVECLYEIKQGDHLYSGPSFTEFENLYKQNYKADNLRIIVRASVPEQQNRAIANIELVLDRVQQSSIHVGGENTNWVNGVFTRFNNLLKEAPTRNIVLHNVFYEMAIQLLAVALITIFAIFSANKFESLVSMKYSEVYTFVIVFLLLSNVLTYINRGMIAIRNKYYPVVDIIRHPRKPIFLSAMIFLSVTMAGWAVNYLLNLLVTLQGK